MTAGKLKLTFVLTLVLVFVAAPAFAAPGGARGRRPQVTAARRPVVVVHQPAVRRPVVTVVRPQPVPVDPHAQIVTNLIYRLRTGSAHQRESAAKKLGWYGGPRAIMALSRLALTDPYADVREEALESLGRIGSTAGMNACVRALLGDRNDEVRERAAQSLGYIGNPGANGALTRAYHHDNDRQVRRAAKKALKRIAARGPQVPVHVPLRQPVVRNNVPNRNNVRNGNRFAWGRRW